MGLKSRVNFYGVTFFYSGSISLILSLAFRLSLSFFVSLILPLSHCLCVSRSLLHFVFLILCLSRSLCLIMYVDAYLLPVFLFDPQHLSAFWLFSFRVCLCAFLSLSVSLRG